MEASDHHFNREDRSRKWKRIAAHLRDHPEDLAIALENMDRWETLGRVHPEPIRCWRERIRTAMASDAGMNALIGFLEAPNHDSEPIKSCSPFVGLPLRADARPAS
ncbi:hypothetical protein [Haloferula helveola]